MIQLLDIDGETFALKKRQVKMRALYCGHLYSLFLCKWTRWHQRGQVSTMWREGQKELEGLLSSLKGDLVGCPVGSLFLMGSRGQ